MSVNTLVQPGVFRRWAWSSILTTPMRAMQKTGIQIASGILGTAIVYASIDRFVGQGPLYDFFCARGPFQHASTFLFFFGMALALARYLKFTDEQATLEYAVPPITAERIEPRLLADQVPAAYRRTLLGRRLIALAQAFSPSADLGTVLERLAQRDHTMLGREYLALSFIRAVIPMVGLLGTVYGLSHGMMDFAGVSGAQDVEAVRAYLQQFAKSSSTAFDTTLLALAYMLPLWVLISVLRNRDEGLLERLDARVDELASKFPAASSRHQEMRDTMQAGMSRFLQGLERSAVESANQMFVLFQGELRNGVSEAVQGWLERWTAELAQVSRGLLDAMAEETSKRNGETTKAFEQQVGYVVGQIESVCEALRNAAEQAGRLSDTARQTVEDHVARVVSQLDGVRQAVEALSQQEHHRNSGVVTEVRGQVSLLIEKLDAIERACTRRLQIKIRADEEVGT